MANTRKAAPAAAPNNAAFETGVRFTVDELRCIHRDLFTAPWQSTQFYDERRAVIAKLDRYFGSDDKHLNRRKDG